MATTASTASSTPPSTAPDPTQVKTQVSSNLTSANTLVQQRVSTASLVQKARLAQQTRTAARLQAQYGAKDPAVKAAVAQVSATTTTAYRLSAVHQQLTAAPPKVTANGWAVYGVVNHADHSAAARFTVFLVDASKTFQHQYGFAYTDASGAFTIDYAGGEAKAESEPALFLEVANTDAEPVYLDTTSFTPVAGSALYRTILLARGDQAIGDPPPPVRREALPEELKKD